MSDRGTTSSEHPSKHAEHAQPAGGAQTVKRSLGIPTKIILTTLGVLVMVVAVNFWVFLTNFKREAQAALVDKASGFTAVADEAKNHASGMIASGSIDQASLVERAHAHIARGGHYKETDFFNAIPVIVGWKSALAAAEREGLDFRIVSFEARNKDNEPEPGSFRHALLTELTAQVKSSGQTVVSGVNRETNTLHYMRAIRLDASCMSCHGDPAVHGRLDEHGNRLGTDILGFKMENWPVGYMHGAYEVAMPLDTMDAAVAAFFTTGMTYTLPLVVLACGGFVLILRGLLSRPLNNLIAMVQDVATGDGDLTKRLNLNRGDEIGRLGHWFDVFLGNLHSIMRDVDGATQEVAGASTQIAASAEQMARGLETQESQTTQVSSAVEEMTQTVGEVAKKSAEAARAAEESQKSASEGGDVVNSTVAEMRGIADEVNQSATSVGELGRKSEKIGEIIGVINDIADQTNLLALNAAIEAARAGEHGRGFAVVADEVRKLAERTQQATEEVGSSIREIQDETSKAVQRIEKGTKRVESGVELAGSAGDALNRILVSSQNLMQMVEGIAAASEEQSAASSEIARSIESISAVTRESSQGAGQAAQAAASLSEQAERLRGLVGRFKL